MGCPALLQGIFPTQGLNPRLLFLHCLQLHMVITVKIAQSCPTLCVPMDCSLPDSSVHEIFQAIVLEWISISFSRELPDPGIEPRSPHCRQTLNRLSHQGIGHLLTWRVHLSVSYLFAFSYCSCSQSKKTEVVCRSFLQWTTFCQNSPL